MNKQRPFSLMALVSNPPSAQCDGQTKRQKQSANAAKSLESNSQRNSGAIIILFENCPNGWLFTFRQRNKLKHGADKMRSPNMIAGFAPGRALTSVMVSEKNCFWNEKVVLLWAETNACADV
ncbi:MAG: hypothetical protein M5U34_17030 [Chloroflexi bacterium]|nr:hypothetical protein [Chloroflexota bacterium]